MSVLVAKFSNGVVSKISNNRSAPAYCGLLQWELYGRVEKQEWYSRARHVVVCNMNDYAAYLMKKFKRDFEIRHYEIVDLVPATAEETMAYKAEMSELNAMFKRKPAKAKDNIVPFKKGA